MGLITERDLDRRVGALEAYTRRIPIRPVGPGYAYPSFLVGGGQTIVTVGVTPVYGIRFVGIGEITVPTAAPAAVHTYPDGLGWGEPIEGGPRVWIATRILGQEDMNSTLYRQIITCRRSVSVPVDTGGTATVWLPWLA